MRCVGLGLSITCHIRLVDRKQSVNGVLILGLIVFMITCAPNMVRSYCTVPSSLTPLPNPFRHFVQSAYSKSALSTEM